MTAARTALVIGGGGPTGPILVDGLRQRGYAVSVLNRGVHPVSLPEDVERIVGDPHFLDPLMTALEGRTFDIVIASYGRLAFTAEALAGRAGHFIGVGGFVLYRGFSDPAANLPSGLPLPVREDAPIVTDPAEHRFSALVAQAEAAVWRYHATGTVFRYPYVYGPRQVVPREWSLVRRVLDGRRRIPVLNGGQGFLMHGYTENLAHSVLLAVDQPGSAAGRAYNCGDEVQLTLRQFVEVAADELGIELDLVTVPDSPVTRALAFGAIPEHKLMDISRIRSDLGYADRVPSVEAMRRTVRWYRDHPLERGGEIEGKLPDRFDYAAEDKLMALADAHAAALSAALSAEMDFVHPYAHPKTEGVGRDERGR